MEYIKYFIFSFERKKEKPCFKIKLKIDSLKKDKPFFYTKNGKKMPISSSSKEYFDHYFDNQELSSELYSFRKKFFDINYCFQFWKVNFDMLEEDSLFVRDYIESIKKIEKENYYLAVKKNSYKENLQRSRSRSSEKARNTVKKKFEDPEFRQKALSCMHSADAKKKRVRSFLETMQKEDVKKKFIFAIKNSEKRKNYYSKRSQDWKKLSSEGKKNILKNFKYNKKYSLNNFKMNMNEYLVGSVLNELNEKWIYEDEVIASGNSYYPDFKIDSKKIIIECYGTFWHADPRIYSEDQIIIGELKSRDIWEKDKIRVDNLKNNGYNVIIIWQNEICGSAENLRSIIKNAIGAQNESS